MMRPAVVSSGTALAAGVLLSLAVNGTFLAVAMHAGPTACVQDADCDVGESCVKRRTSPTAPEPEVGICVSRGAKTGTRTALRSSVRHGLCGKRRCSVPEIASKRRDIAQAPYENVELVAQLVPALGMKAPDPKKMPKLQTYEQERIVKSGVNLDRKNPRKKKKLRKKFTPKKARRDPKSVADLLRRDHDEKDLRKKATRVQDIVGEQDGVIGGAQLKRDGVRYGWRVIRKMRPLFRAPNLEPDALKKMRIDIKVTKMRADGAILKYRVVYRSSHNTPAFTAAAIELIKRFVKPRRGEPERTLPKPSPELLRWFNARGLKLRLTGKALTR